jgi:hypothetical protein
VYKGCCHCNQYSRYLCDKTHIPVLDARLIRTHHHGHGLDPNHHGLYLNRHGLYLNRHGLYLNDDQNQNGGQAAALGQEPGPGPAR